MEKGVKHLLHKFKGGDEKAFCLLATSYKGAWANGMTLIITNMKDENSRIGGVTITERGIRPHRGDSRKSGLAEYGTILYTSQKSNTLTTEHQSYIIENTTICVASRGRKTENGTNQQMLEPCPAKGKTNCLTTVAKDNMLMLENIEGREIRRLTPTECARLQTIPEWYKWECSNTQQYKMLGNGWTVEVIKHILSFLPEELLKGQNNMSEEKKIECCENCALCVHTYLGSECGLTDNPVSDNQPGCIDYIAED